LHREHSNGCRRQLWRLARISGLSVRPDEHHAAQGPRFDSVRCSRTGIRSRTNGVPARGLRIECCSVTRLMICVLPPLGEC
jgi:hypothetical protein